MFLLKNAALAAMLCACCVTSAFAMGRGQNANEVPVINPDTHQATEIWRLSGYFPTLGVSAVQISPAWIISSKHAAPPTGTMFGNGFGVARVEFCHVYNQESHPDIALCKLQKKISTPSNFKFPMLVQAPDELANSRSLETLARDMGQFLAVGYGGPQPGSPMFAWTDLISMPLVDASPDLLGLRTAAPYVGVGDSGSPLFWFSPKTEKIGLIGVRMNPGSVGPFGLTAIGGFSYNFTKFSPSILSWISSKIGEYGDDGIEVSSALDFHGQVRATPSWIGRGALDLVASTATSLDVKWSAPKSNAADVKKYFVYIIQGDKTTRSGFVNSNVLTYSAVGLRTGVESLACVTPSGTGGFAPFGAAQKVGTDLFDVSWELAYSCTGFRLDPAPSAVQGLDIKIVNRDFGASGVWPSEVITWTRPASPAQPVKIYYQLKSTVDGETPTYKSIKDGEVSKGPIRTVKGQKICVSVTSYTGPATVGQTSEQKCAVVN